MNDEVLDSFSENKPVERLFAIMVFCAVVPLYFEETRQVLGLIFISFMGYLLFRKKPQDYVFFNNEKNWIVVSIVYALVFVISFLLRPPYTYDGSWRIEAPIFILLLSIWYFLAIRYKVETFLIKYLAVISVSTALCLLILENLILQGKLEGYRLGAVLSDLGATGFIVPITAVLLAVIWLSNKQKKYLVLLVICFLLTAISGSRTSFSLVLIPMLFAVFYMLFGGTFFPRKKKLFVVLLSITAVAIATWFSKDKLRETYVDYKAVQQGDFHSSMGLRYAMNDVGFKVVKENMWIGVGPSQYKESLKKALVRTEYTTKEKDSIVDFMQIHNQYLMDMILSGWLGLLSVIAFIFLPAIIFIRLLQHNRQSLALRVAIGLSVAIGFVQLFGANFTYTYTTIFYVIAMGALVSFLSKEQESLR